VELDTEQRKTMREVQAASKKTVSKHDVSLEMNISQEAVSDNLPSDDTNHRPAYVLPAIVGSQFAGTALWFSGNAIIPDLVDEWDNLDESSVAFLTSSVQLGFILGTLVFALLSIADRYMPTKVFLVCALAGATCNAILPACGRTESLGGLVFLRLATGFFLAGIYPVGMKVAADWFEAGLGKALGWLVGALAFGSSFPFLLRQIPQSWQALTWETSALASIGGLIVGFLVPNGPYRKAGTQKLDPSIIFGLFRDRRFASAAISYWGHMWELYAFWTWTPVVWESYLEEQSNDRWSPSLVTFLVIAFGGFGCIIGGYLSTRYGSARVAFGSLAISGSLCLLSPALYLAPIGVMLPSYLLWGMAVVADSPQFSTLVAQTAPTESKGTALTIVNCVGFAVTIGSIQLLAVPIPEQYLFLLLVPGPIIGLWSLWIVHIRGHDTVTEKSTEKTNENT
jgi:MFS family permease